MKTIQVNGDIVNDSDAWVYDWFGEPYTCPKMIRDAVNTLEVGEELIVEINSGGGYVSAGQEIYSILKNVKNLTIHIQSMAASAASIIACAGRCLMSPVAMMMIHNVSGGASGDFHEMDKMSEILKTFNEALATAYVEKTGKTLDEVLTLMDSETWLTAKRAIDEGFADGLIEDEKTAITNDVFGLKITPEMRKRAEKEKAEKEKKFSKTNEIYHIIVDDLDRFGV